MPSTELALLAVRRENAVGAACRERGAPKECDWLRWREKKKASGVKRRKCGDAVAQEEEEQEGDGLPTDSRAVEEALAPLSIEAVDGRRGQ